MTYYEELGISADATEEQIRQAHRRLVKLLHPDPQPDPEVRRLAERQLARVNLMVERLLDPAQRQSYDSSLLRTAPVTAPPIPLDAWKIAILGVCVVCILAMLSVSSPTDAVRSAGGGVVSAAPPSTAAVPPPGSASNARRNSGRKAPDEEPSVSLGGTPPSTPEVEIATPANPPESRPQGANSMPQPETPPQKAAAEQPVESAPSLRGVWLYAGGKPTEKDKGLYRPEYIEMRISERDGQVKGDFRSRYAVTNLAISPSVNFTFVGKAEQGATLEWQGAKGALGTLTIHLLHRNAIHVDWKVTDAGESGMGLEFGTATLVRRL